MICEYCGEYIANQSDLRQELIPIDEREPPGPGRREYRQYHRLCYHMRRLSDWVIAYQQTARDRSREPTYLIILILVEAVTDLIKIAVQTQ